MKLLKIGSWISSGDRRNLCRGVDALFVIGIGAVAVGCGKTDHGRPGAGDAGRPPKVVTTTTMVSDLVARIGGDSIERVALMGAGVDPHLYKIPPAGVAHLTSADLVIYSGLHLEGRMDELFADLKSRGVPLLGVAEQVPEDQRIFTDDGGHVADPHVWGDVSLWARAIGPLVDALSGVAPGSAEVFERRGEALESEFEALHAWAKSRIAEIPEPRRVLITSHDAFNYFGRAYSIDVIGLQGISTVDEASLAGMAKLVDLIKARDVKAVFVESSVNDDPLVRVARDAGVSVGGTLFSDAMGTPGETETFGGDDAYDVGTYPGMIKHNVNTVVEALK